MRSFLEFENFFSNADEVRKFALSQKFYNCKDHPTEGNWPGIRTEYYHLLNEDMYYQFTSRLYELMGWDNNKDTYFEAMFQLCTASDGNSWIHNDKMTQRFTHVGMVYLTPNPKPNSGTIIYDLKENVDTDSQDFITNEGDPKNFNVNSIITNEYNKCIMYDPKSWHKSDTYFGSDIYDGRLTLVFFLREEGAVKNFSQPISRPIDISELGFEGLPEDKVTRIEEVPESITSRFSAAENKAENKSETEPENDDISIFDYDNNEEAWEKKYLTPSAISHEWDLIVDELGHQGHTSVFKWSLFSEAFCKEIIDLSETEGTWTQKRHEFYPTTDMLLDNIGLNSVYEKVLQKHCYPAATYLYGLEGKNWESLKGENFIIKYKSDGQPHLSLHHDYSRVTFLTNLTQHGKDYEGGGTYFARQKLLFKGDLGDVTLHPGNITHKHGARPTTKGTRYVIVSFCNCQNE